MNFKIWALTLFLALQAMVGSAQLTQDDIILLNDNGKSVSIGQLKVQVEISLPALVIELQISDKRKTGLMVVDTKGQVLYHKTNVANRIVQVDLPADSSQLVTLIYHVDGQHFQKTIFVPFRH